ncbi:MAG: CinA family protein [Endozoicomonadaceae bacterium]|nr:CinA family protein [Endozoicomonadaceae bacterium]
MDKELFELASDLGKYLQTSGNKIAVAESCTGGWIAQAITEVPGSSAWFDRGFVTYSNLAKVEMLGVKQETLDNHGAVSFETAREMVQGVLNNSTADLAIAVTGIAGPGGGTYDKPVGTVFLAWEKRAGDSKVVKKQFQGDRNAVRRQAVVCVLKEKG